METENMMDNQQIVLSFLTHPDDAEGFRQHLGHGYPQNNVLGKELSELGIKI